MHPPFFRAAANPLLDATTVVAGMDGRNPKTTLTLATRRPAEYRNRTRDPLKLGLGLRS